MSLATILGSPRGPYGVTCKTRVEPASWGPDPPCTVPALPVWCQGPLSTAGRGQSQGASVDSWLLSRSFCPQGPPPTSGLCRGGGGVGHRGESGSVGRKEAGSGLGRGEQERLPVRFVSFPESPQWGSAAFCREELRPGLVGALLRTLPLAVSLAGPPLSGPSPLSSGALSSGPPDKWPQAAPHPRPPQEDLWGLQ